jgi:hypothetical protein
MKKARQKLVSNEMFMREIPQTFSVPKTILQERLKTARNGSEDRTICSASWPDLKAIFGKGWKHTC